jgi:predicted DNA-binding antitoxin AbrB/MazE fold protein
MKECRSIAAIVSCPREPVIELHFEELNDMSITVEAIYEAGVFKPLLPLSHLKEHERVRITLEVENAEEDALKMIARQRRERIRIAPQLASEIGDNHELDLLGS